MDDMSEDAADPNDQIERLTWQEWNERLGAGIYDPDGFRGRRASADRLYTQEEFYERWPECSVLISDIDTSGPLGHWAKTFGPDADVGRTVAS